LRRAVRLFSKSLRLHPTDVWALNNRGLAYLKMGKPEKARRDFEEALGIDPGFEAATMNLEKLRTDAAAPDAAAPLDGGDRAGYRHAVSARCSRGAPGHREVELHRQPSSPAGVAR
jgi:tetratricopeptide (TPR) repeat protein